ncbi:MAG: DUF4433 domain-containing protein [Gammaproteobacteria bacterium]|nr:DUF4433 domain-containing protein [Gammaproteobacteria bacterium]
MMIPDPIRLFHITAIDNLDAICQSGNLVCKNDSTSQGINYQNIAHSGAQGSRAAKAVPIPPGGTIHDYVPFYFAPRSPMLSAIENGRVSGCGYRQEDIVHLETTIPNVMLHNQELVFYDLNATLAWSKPYTDIHCLERKVAWGLITEHPRLDGYCKYFFNRPTDTKYVDRMEKRMAEFLFKTAVPLVCMTRIGVINDTKAQIVCSILAENGVELSVEVMKDWYFLGQ